MRGFFWSSSFGVILWEYLYLKVKILEFKLIISGLLCDILFWIWT